jgi:mRNA-degrading endonuclease toxin of MazEF toxin-antitoxin module
MESPCRDPDEIYLASFPFGVDPAAAEDASTNLRTTSVLRLHKLATIHARSVVRRLGVLSPATAAEVDGKLQTLLGL